MIVEYIRYRIPDHERRIAFEKACDAAAEQLDLAPQCLGYELTRGVEEPDRYTLRVGWASVEDHEQGFRGGPYFRAYLAELRPYLGDIEDVGQYEPTSVLSRRRF
ncbi:MULTISPECIES: antibiotic biosynthesis monooxygenase family protein [Streptomycetaceae]|uniref:Antibiotic biosynthesis monooxygenase n=1 Tax=Streptantibioticus parmotrematis TaxID=2873249 RepID=A0ABS7QSX9_9ACTN|nr:MULTISPECIES: antibiotic biosynthesis monooxygenase family protein [Streptomycetaceae]MBY8886296.1 antibiotic biosynthesis monooxygenase [Streptantibioticus parmotrematis]PWI43311.1 antibiotic biosynthesis monooxygenase [Streptomyces sp. ICBB 8177]